MSMFTLNQIYRSVSFDEEELRAMQIACIEMATRNCAAVDEASEASIEEHVKLTGKMNDTLMASGLAALFKPHQEILIEKEDLEVILSILREHSKSAAADSHAHRAMERIELCLNLR